MAQQHIPAKNIYMDKQSGKDFNRPNYQKVWTSWCWICPCWIHVKGKT